MEPLRRLEDRPLTATAMAWLLTAQALAVAPFALHLPAWVVGGSLAGLAWRAWLVRRDSRLPARWLLLLLLGLVVAAIITHFGGVRGPEPGVSLLLLLLGLKQLETRALRDATIGVFLTYLAAATYFFFSQEILTVLYILGVVILTTAALLALNEGPTPLPVRTKLRAAGLLLAQSLPLMAVLFVLFPRLEGPLWGSLRNSGAARTGLSDSMSPGDISRLITSEEIAFRVSFDRGPPPEAQRYWRGPVLWLFDGRTWRLARESAPALPPEPDATAVPFDYTVTLQPHDQHWLLGLDVPATVPDKAYQTEAFHLLAQEPVRELRQYRLRSYTQYTIGLEPTELDRRLGLQLPPGRAPRARALAQQWREASADPAEVVERALRYFNTEPFRYTLSPAALPVDPVDQFLFETREGFCEHYASSFTVLMRAAGIPARVVTGYQGGQLNPLGDYLLVRQSDAHAWAEVWLEGRGWVRVDPTASVAPERVERGIGEALGGSADLPVLARGDAAGLWRLRASLLWDSANYHWNYWVVAFDPERQRELLQRMGLERFGLSALIIGLVVSIGALLLAYGALYAWRTRPRGRDQVGVLYARFCARLARCGIVRAPHEGPADFARRAVGLRPDLAPDIHAISDCYVALRYAGEAPASLSALREAVGRFRPRRAGKKKPAEAG